MGKRPVYTMKLSAYGRAIELQRDDDAWRAFDLGTEGKKRRAYDVIIPGDIPESEVITYLADLLHEHATARHPDIVVLEDS